MSGRSLLDLAAPRIARKSLGGRVPSWKRLFSKLERVTQQTLNTWVWPRVPGLDRIYGNQLQRTLERVDIDVPLRGLDPAFDGTRLLFLSDLHAGPFLSPNHVARLFDRLDEWKPDAVLWVGDLMTSRVAELIPIREALEGWTPPLGQFAVLGNHEHYSEDVSLLVDMLEASNVRVLTNRSVAFERGSARLWLAGVDDWRAGQPDLFSTLRPWRERGASEPLVLMSHHPDIFPVAARAGVPLVLSGHTHGGQIRGSNGKPWVVKSSLGLVDGCYLRDDSTLLLSRGLGVTGLPFRYQCAPQAWQLTLRADPAPDPTQQAAA